MTWTSQKSKESKTASDGSGPVPNETPLETDTTSEIFELTSEELEKIPLPKSLKPLKTVLKKIESEVLSKESGKKPVESKVDIFNDEEYMPTDTVAVPIVVWQSQLWSFQGGIQN